MVTVDKVLFSPETKLPCSETASRHTEETKKCSLGVSKMNKIYMYVCNFIFIILHIHMLHFLGKTLGKQFMDKINRQKNTIHEKWKCFIIFMYEKYYQEEKKIDSQVYPGSCLLQFWILYNTLNSAFLLSVQSTSTNESVFAFVLQVAQQRQCCIVSIPHCIHIWVIYRSWRPFQEWFIFISE